MVRIGGNQAFWAAKRLFDVLMSVLLLPVLGVVALLLLIVNPALNPGPLFFQQSRVGQHGRHFAILKFRTMRTADVTTRFADSEADRIRPFGRQLRRYRIDELPQIINVIKSEMSLIGPRPEQPDFARHYQEAIPGYALRHMIRPGLSGLAQVTQGYTSDTGGTQRKLSLDLRYIRDCGFRLESYILWRTLITLCDGPWGLVTASFFAALINSSS